MAHCPECDAELEGDPFEFEEGEIIECPECGVELEVINTTPLELEPLEPEDEDDEIDEDFDAEEWN